MRKLLSNFHAFIDLGSVIVIGAVFVALMFVAYIIYTLKTLLNPTGDAASTMANVTKGFDQAVNFLVIAVIISIAAIAIAALFFMRRKSE